MNVYRLHLAIAAVCPIVGVSVGTWGQANTVRIDFDAGATAQQQGAAQTALQAFDFSDAADAVFQTQQFVAQASAGIDNGQTASADYPNMMVAALMSAALEQVNAIRTAVVPPLPPIQLAQFVASVKAAIVTSAATANTQVVKA